MAASLSQREEEEEREEEREPEPNPEVPGEQSPSEEHRAEALRALLSARKRKAGLQSPEGKVPWSPLNDLLCATVGVRAVRCLSRCRASSLTVSYITSEEATEEEDWKSVPKKRQLLDSDEEEDDEAGRQGRTPSSAETLVICLILLCT